MSARNHSHNSNENMRRHKRAKVSFIFTYQVDKPQSLCAMIGRNVEIDAIMLDLSESGMSFLTDYYIPVSSVLFLKFVLIYFTTHHTERVRLIKATGEVRSNLLLEKNEYRLGLRFTYLSEEDRKAIANFVTMNGLSHRID